MCCWPARRLAVWRTGRISCAKGQGVAVPLRIYDYVKIPKGSKFSVGSSGLLGDRFVNVMMPSGKPKEFLPTTLT